jgi:hypothetical protein
MWLFTTRHGIINNEFGNFLNFLNTCLVLNGIQKDQLTVNSISYRGLVEVRISAKNIISGNVTTSIGGPRIDNVIGKTSWLRNILFFIVRTQFPINPRG